MGYNRRMLIMGMTAPEIRLLQEFRRLSTETLDLEKIKAIKHPAGGGEGPARSLGRKGFLVEEDGGGRFTLTEKARQSDVLVATPTRFHVRLTRDAIDDLGIANGSTVWLALRSRAFRIVG